MRNRQASFGAVLLGMLLLAAGCRSLPRCESSTSSSATARIPDPTLLSRHVIEVNAEGFVFDLRPDQKPEVLTNRWQLARYLHATVFEGFQASGKKKILLFVHGGLNDRDAGMAHFWNSYESVLQGDYYPVFLVWPSGWSATYVEHLLWVRQGLKAETPNEKTFSLLTSPATLLADLGRSLTRLPLVVANNTRSDIETVTAIRTREGGAVVQQYEELAREGYPVAIGDDYSRPSDRVVRGVTYWTSLPVKYLLGSFIDGFGKGAWDNMLRRTQAVYPARFQGRTLEWMNRMRETNRVSTAQGRPAAQRSLTTRQVRRAQRYAAAGLPMFIEMLRAAQETDPSLQVTLVGHSMGAIILNRVVRDAALELENIVYLAAACSVEDFATSVLPYLREHRVTQFYSLSLHPVAEAGEWQPAFADLTPRGSLLVWIDNFLSNPVTEQERTLGRWRNLFRSGTTGEPIVRQFYSGDRTGSLTNRLHFLAFSVGFGGKDKLRSMKYQWNAQPSAKELQERCDTPLSHGEFSQLPYWERSFWWQPAVAEPR